MLRFFRAIRQRLLAENRLSKYLLYATGEIILVVIGILIALQINTWNEGRKAKILEQDYYCRLLEDVDLDHVQVDELMAASKERLQAANLALRFLLTDHPKKLDVAREINNAIKAIYSDFEANDAAFVDLKSGANLNIIRDKAVITALNNYFNKVEGFVSVIQVNGENALKIFYSHDDVFESGWALASLNSGWVSQGIDPDLREQMALDENETLSDAMQSQLLSDVLLLLSHNQRQIILYTYIQEEIVKLRAILESKCP